MTDAAAETRTLQLPAVGHESRRRGSAPADCRRAGPTLAYSDYVNFLGGPIMNSSLQGADPAYETVLAPLDGSQLADGAMVVPVQAVTG
jgi:hypothetical protein